VFGLRSPLRPNPIALAVVRLLGIDAATGRIEIDAIDCLDGTPLLDIKPYLPSVDAVPDAIGR
jgi:tRNA (adenine37-N6)-methyltransferase